MKNVYLYEISFSINNIQFDFKFEGNATNTDASFSWKLCDSTVFVLYTIWLRRLTNFRWNHRKNYVVFAIEHCIAFPFV